MEERLKALRKELDLNQQEFAEKINLGQSTWAMIEVGKRALNDRHILLICSVFNIRKEWLKEGKGEMFEKIPEEDEFFKAATELSKNNDKMVMQAVIEYWKLDDESKKLFKDFILHIVEKSKESNKELKRVKLKYEKEAVKHINKLDRPTKQRIKEAIEKLPLGDVKKLQGFKNDYRLRVGNLRVLFSIEKDTITIKDVLPRGQAYKRI